jgi:hypothetical protein
MDTADNECPRLSHLVSGGRKGAGEDQPCLAAKVFLLISFCGICFLPPPSSLDEWCFRAFDFGYCWHRCAVSPCGSRLTPPGVVGNVLLVEFFLLLLIFVEVEGFRVEASEIVSLYIHDVHQ